MVHGLIYPQSSWLTPGRTKARSRSFRKRKTVKNAGKNGTLDVPTPPRSPLSRCVNRPFHRAKTVGQVKIKTSPIFVQVFGTSPALADIRHRKARRINTQYLPTSNVRRLTDFWPLPLARCCRISLDFSPIPCRCVLDDRTTFSIPYSRNRDGSVKAPNTALSGSVQHSFYVGSAPERCLPVRG